MILEPDKLFKLIQDSDFETVGIDVQYKVIKMDDTLLLLFQESTSDTDWKTNFDWPIKAYKKQENTIYGHRGFIKAWKSCNDIIMEEFIKAITEGYKEINNIVIAGWSFGGAMAQLASEDLFFRTRIQPVLITFGSPKILCIGKTKKYFENCVDPRSKQYANRSDFVTKVPPIYTTFKKVKLGKFNLIKLFKSESHCIYGDKNLY